jgi:Mce-associated membrane protein
VRKPKLGNRRVASPPNREGDITVQVETETVTGRASATEIDDSEDVKSVADSEDEPFGGIDTQGPEGVEAPARWRRITLSRVLGLGVLPGLVLVIAVAAGYLKWQDGWVRGSRVAGIEAVAAAKDSTIALLSYQPDTVDRELKAARDRLTGSFKDSYTQLIQDVVIPGAKKQHISAVATVPGAASVSANPIHAVALLYVDQTVVVGADAPTDTSSIVRVTLDRTGGRWLISGFDPI